MCGVYQPLSLSKPYVEEIPPTKPDQDKFKATAVQGGGGNTSRNLPVYNIYRAGNERANCSA